MRTSKSSENGLYYRFKTSVKRHSPWVLPSVAMTPLGIQGTRGRRRRTTSSMKGGEAMQASHGVSTHACALPASSVAFVLLVWRHICCLCMDVRNWRRKLSLELTVMAPSLSCSLRGIRSMRPKYAVNDGASLCTCCFLISLSFIFAYYGYKE
jgi:hypothetical protein